MQAGPWKSSVCLGSCGADGGDWESAEVDRTVTSHRLTIPHGIGLSSFAVAMAKLLMPYYYYYYYTFYF